MPQYKTIYRDRAIKEYTDSLNWYKRYSFEAAENFQITIANTVNVISQHPDHLKIAIINFI